MKRIALAVILLCAALPAREPTTNDVVAGLIQQVRTQQDTIAELTTAQLQLQKQVDVLEEKVQQLEQAKP